MGKNSLFRRQLLMRTDHEILHLLSWQQLQKNDSIVEKLPGRPNEMVWRAFNSAFLLIAEES